MQTKLELFEPLNIETANALLNLLNDGRKKDLFVPVIAMEYGDYLIVCAGNKEDVLFNIVDSQGKIPDGFCVNWRVAQLIRHDLNLPTPKH